MKNPSVYALPRKRIFVALVVILIGLLAASANIIRRSLAESDMRGVEICIDLHEIEGLSEIWGFSVNELLLSMRESGATTIALDEERVIDYRNSGVAVVLTGTGIFQLHAAGALNQELLKEMLHGGGIDPQNTYIIFKTDDPSRTGNLAHMKGGIIKNGNNGQYRVIEHRGDMNSALAIRLGFSEERLNLLRGMGYRIVLRAEIANNGGSDIVERLKQLDGVEGVSSILLRGMNNLEGDAAGIDHITGWMRERSIPLGIIEFTDVSGSVYKGLAAGLDYGIVRVHTIPDSELFDISRDESLARYIRGVKERGIGLLLLNLYPSGDSDRRYRSDFTADFNFVDDLCEELEKNGFSVGEASRLPELHASEETGALLIIMTALISYIIAMLLLPSEAEGILKAVVLFSVLILLFHLFSKGGHMVYKIPAFAASLAFPLLSGCSLLTFGITTDGRCENSGGMVILISLKYWAIATLISIAGGLFIAGLLFDSAYILNLDRFSGVKAMYIIPVIIYGAGFPYYIARLRGKSGKPPADLKRWLNSPLRLIHLCAVFSVIAAFVIYIGRTGNDFPVPLPRFDKGIRLFLEELLPVRPRLKELFIGHPSMITSATLIINRRYKEAWPFFLLGMIGEISVVNTFAHIHTPLAVSFLRTLLGAVIAIPLGVMLYFVYDRLFISLVRREKSGEVSGR